MSNRNKTLTQIFPVRKKRVAHETAKQSLLTTKRQKISSAATTKKKVPLKKEVKAAVAPSSSQEKQEHMTILRHFDMNWEYGPCTGITRLQRWHRAEKLEQDPPELVKDLIEAHENDKDYAENVWSDYSF